MRGMLTQLAAATAANGTYLAINGGALYIKKNALLNFMINSINDNFPALYLPSNLLVTHFTVSQVIDTL